MKNKLFIPLLIILLTGNAGYTTPASVSDVAVKFSFAMLWVVISAIVIFVGLFIFNKFKNNYINVNYDEEAFLKSPKTKDEAVSLFINKNKIL